MKNSNARVVLSIMELKELFTFTIIGCLFTGGIAASVRKGTFTSMLFGRDSLRAILDLMRHKGYHPQCRDVFSLLPQWQGVKMDTVTNERPGALPHQVFRQIVGGIRLPDEDLDNIRVHTDKWGVELNHNSKDGYHFVIYNSSDAPPLYLIALVEYIRQSGSDDVLRDKYTHWPTGKERTVAQAARLCLEYIYHASIESDMRGLGGLYAVPNTNPLQTSPSGKLEDGFDAILRPTWDSNGVLTATPVDFSFAAYIDHQALAVWSLELGARELFPTDEDAPEWARTANNIRQQTLNRFWMDSRGTFGVAVDKHGLSELETVSALEMLNGTILKKGVKDAPDYVRSLARWPYGTKVLTEGGPAMTSSEFQSIWDPYVAYQGPGSVWPVRTNTVFSGFLNWGLPGLAGDMVDRNLGMLMRAGAALEGIYVDPFTGTLLYPAEQNDGPADVIILPSSPFETGQCWTASSGLRQIWWEEDDPPMGAKAGSWQHDLEEELNERIEAVLPASRAPFDLRRIKADFERGKTLKEEFAYKHGLKA